MLTHLFRLLYLVGLLSSIPLHSFARESPVPQLINYQGKITTETEFLPTGDYTLSFTIFDKPVGAACVSTTEDSCARRIWGPQVFDGRNSLVGHGAKVPVVKGFFNVILGPYDTHGSPILDAFSSANSYLEVKVEDEAPVRPRQQVLSAPYALTSVGDVPVGGITMYSGDTGDLPGNWRACNGDWVRDPDSPLSGQRLPDLRGLFVRGFDNRTDQVMGTLGGLDRIHAHNHTFKARGVTHKRRPISLHSMPCHDKKLDGQCAYQHTQEFDDYFLYVTHKKGDSGQVHSLTTPTQSQYTGSLPSADNRPRHISLHYIIRIK